MIHPDDLRPDIRGYLEGWYAKSKARQENKGNLFQLSFGEFLELWGRRRIRSLEKWMDEGSLFVRQRRHTKANPNPHGYVLGYRSFAASQSGQMTRDNAQICTRAQCLIDCRMGKGDQHSDASRQAISQGTRGIAKSEKHRRAISQSMTGKKRGPMTQAEKDKRAEGARAAWAAKKGVQG